VPKVVDHDVRRRELAAVVWRLIARDGIEGVSIRDVAVESGWSSGALRHYFRTKEELMVYAADLVIDRVTRRVEGPSPEATLTEAARAVLRELLPLDEERRVEAAIWLAFVSRSLVDPSIADRQRIAYSALRDVCAGILREVADRGLLAAGLDPDREAGRLHALLDGWSLHLLMGRLDPPAVAAALDAHLAQVIRED
jgi:AcrR family transcriptional regulator